MSRLTTLILICFFALSHSALALSSAWKEDEAVRVRLVSGIDAVGQETTIPLGLDVELNDTWHTYWRSPGMAGLPPQLDWQRSQSMTGNLKDATLHYPAPKRYKAYNLETIGYSNHVLFPIDAVIRTAGQSLALNVDVSLLVCSSLCVPKNFTLSLEIPSGEATASDEAELIRQFRDRIPTGEANSGISIRSIINDGAGITLTIDSKQALTAPDAFIETEAQTAFNAPIVTINDNKHTATLRLVPTDPIPAQKPLAGTPVTLTITDDAMALEQRVTLPSVGATSASPPPLPSNALPLWLALTFALIGGFILNLMPCVLPVLSLKVLSVISHGGGTPHLVRRSFMTTALGIITSFLILGGGTAILRAIGLNFGWGVQFQQPTFLIFLVLLLTFFTANMWEFFEIALPRFLADRVASTSYHPKLAGDFATGAFATLLATPCSAPFLGTAVGFAFTAPPAIILLVFAALGLGMAIPYILIALFPRIATSLPKPGTWMLQLRRVLGVALALTAIWLLWVLAAQITAHYAILVGLNLTAILILLALAKRGWKQKPIWIAITALIILIIGLVNTGSLLPKPKADMDSQWQGFSAESLATMRAEGKTIFLDITADWCITCKANKNYILSDAALKKRLFHTDIIAMQADWTNPDPVIADFLRKYGRYGIPFNIVFGQGAPEGIILPEILTPSLVTDALDKASKSAPK